MSEHINPLIFISLDSRQAWYRILFVKISLLIKQRTSILTYSILIKYFVFNDWINTTQSNWTRRNYHAVLKKKSIQQLRKVNSTLTNESDLTPKISTVLDITPIWVITTFTRDSKLKILLLEKFFHSPELSKFSKIKPPVKFESKTSRQFWYRGIELSLTWI